MISSVSTAMREQNTAVADITRAGDSMRQQADQAARALKEQARAMKDMTTASANTARQIKLITHANREHSTTATSVLTELGDVRRIADRNATGAKQTRAGTAELVRQAEALTDVIDGLAKKTTH